MKDLRPGSLLRALPLAAALWLSEAVTLVRAQAPLTNIADIRALPREVAARHLPVKVSGVVTIGSTIKNDFFFIQCEGEGLHRAIGVSIPQAIAEGLPPVEDGRPDHGRPGYLVEIEGVTGSGDFTPVILPRRIVNLGMRELPAAVEPTLAELLTGIYDCQRVGVRGVVQRVERSKGSKPVRLVLAAERGGYLAVDALLADGLDERLLDAWVYVKGLALTYFNNRGELLGVRLMVNGRSDLTVERPPPADPFDAPFVNLDRIGAFSPQPPSLHRRRVEGVVTLSQPREFFYLQSEDRAIRVTTSQAQGPAIGDRVEAAGFVSVSQPYAELREALFRKTGSGPLPEAVEVTWKTVIGAIGLARNLQTRDFDGRLIRLQGRFEQIEDVPGLPLRIHLKHQGHLIPASLEREFAATTTTLRAGSELEVKGICVMSFEGTWPLLSGRAPTGFRILLRSPEDVTVLKAASWWTPARLGYTLAITMAVLVLTLVWVWMLRRAVDRQSRRLAAVQRAKQVAGVEFKATLRERNRLAADLHDTLEQGLTAVALQLETARVIREEQPGQARERTDLAYELLDRCRDDLRRSVWSLRVGILEGRGFPEALRELAARTGRTYGVSCSCDVETDDIRVPEFEANHLLLLVQEAITNALKHAGSTAIAIRANLAPSGVCVSIADTGKGFDPSQAPEPEQGHFGLLGMRERVQALGGKLAIHSAPGQGTRVEVSVPLP